MWRRPPRPSRDGGAERPQARNPKAGTCPSTKAHHPHHSEPQPPKPHPSANKYTDKSNPRPATASRPPDKTISVHSACTGPRVRRNLAPLPTKSQATADPQSSRPRTLVGIVADL